MKVYTQNTNRILLDFEEEENGDLRTASERVRRLAPQIRHHRAEQFGWSPIHCSLVSIGINLSLQSVKNIVSGCADKRIMAPLSKELSRATGLEPARGRFNKRL